MHSRIFVINNDDVDEDELFEQRSYEIDYVQPTEDAKADFAWLVDANIELFEIDDLNILRINEDAVEGLFSDRLEQIEEFVHTRNVSSAKRFCLIRDVFNNYGDFKFYYEGLLYSKEAFLTEWYLYHKGERLEITQVYDYHY